MPEANSAHTENKGAFGWSCGGPSCGCSGQEARHCGETAVLGGKPLGTQPWVQREHCSARTLGLGAAGLGLALSGACEAWVLGPGPCPGLIQGQDEGR